MAVVINGTTGIDKVQDGSIGTADIAADAITTPKIASSVNLGRRNLMINGAMNVAQRGISFSGTSGGAESQFTTDRWRYGHKTGTVTVTQNSVSDLAGFQNSVKIQVTGTGTVAAGDQDVFEQKIEGQNLVSAGWGQTGAKDLTLSFYYKSNSTDNRVAWFYNPERGRDFAVIFAATAADTWERITINIPADQAFNDSNGAGLYVRVVLNSGSDFTTGLASTWSAIGNDRYAGVANFHSSTSNYVEFTGVQLEIGDTATEFEHRSYGEELSLCERYYIRYTNESSDQEVICFGVIADGDSVFGPVHLPVKLRASPTVSSSGSTDFQVSTVFGGGGGTQTASVQLGYAGTRTPSLHAIGATGGLSTGARLIRFASAGYKYLEFDAEL